MPKNINLKKVLVVGSGPIIVGQAAEFDYAGTQACKALKEEGIEIVLVNSNPATIMTDDTIADKVYIHPLTLESLAYIIKKERPDGIIATLGGQTGLNISIELDEAGILEKYNVQVLGTSLNSIKKAEDRELFRNLMHEIKEPVPESTIVSNIDDANQFAEKTGLPLIIRPAYTLGGTGGGIAHSMEELRDIASRGLLHSRIHQILLEESVHGWKEVEYEIMRDSNDTCIVVCNMENFDPVGIHTGDSIVVAPSQTLSDEEYHMLRTSSLRIVRALKIEGGCNVQFALNPESLEYRIIEVNPRVSRSSALASKASGYPIAKIAAKIAIGLHLHEIPNCITHKTMASFEPALDYIVTKIPKWPFDKFGYADRTLNTQMKATGEVMAIDRNFESSFLKALISLEGKETSLRKQELETLSKDTIYKKLSIADDTRIFTIAEALRKGVTIDEIYQVTKIDRWFLYKLNNIIELEKRLSSEPLSIELLQEAERKGFSDTEIEALSGIKSKFIDVLRRAHGIYPVYKIVDTCAAEFESSTPYYYSTYETEDENIVSRKEKILVIGSGPIRIGQGIEFDYCSVHAVWAFKEAGYESIIINNNPETVSTDFDIADKLYFEPLFIEDVMNVVRKEKPKGAIIQFGGQTAINLGPKLKENGVQIMGTTVGSSNVAEDREMFEALLDELNILRPCGHAVTTFEEAKIAALDAGYPVLVRPSYVIGGRAMQIVMNEEELESYMLEAVSISSEHPVLVDHYIEGKEVEVDAISDINGVLIPGILEHIERTGVHSGDSFAVYPAQNLSQKVIDTIVDYTFKLAKAIRVIGLMNIQFVVDKNENVYVIEVNPRASRTVPVLSKVTKVPMVKIAVDVILGNKIPSIIDCYQSKKQDNEIYYNYGLYPFTNLVAVKAPVFSFQKLSNVEVSLAAEMKSTGEVLGIDNNYHFALTKAFLAAGYSFPEAGKILVSLNKKDQDEALDVIKEFIKLGFNILATEGTAKTCQENGIDVEFLDKHNIENTKQEIQKHKISIVINTPTISKDPKRFGFIVRSYAEQYKVPCFSSLDTVKAYIAAYKTYTNNRETFTYEPIDYYINNVSEKLLMV
jgi:carbamoyl-phosphate synthase large subunit